MRALLQTICFAVPYMGVFTTAEWGPLTIYFTDGVNPETVDKFISIAYPGADPEPIKEAYNINDFNGRSQMDFPRC